jgi:hypothetical protein
MAGVSYNGVYAKLSCVGCQHHKEACEAILTQDVPLSFGLFCEVDNPFCQHPKGAIAWYASDGKTAQKIGYIPEADLDSVWGDESLATLVNTDPYRIPKLIPTPRITQAKVDHNDVLHWIEMEVLRV